MFNGVLQSARGQLASIASPVPYIPQVRVPGRYNGLLVDLCSSFCVALRTYTCAVPAKKWIERILVGIEIVRRALRNIQFNGVQSDFASWYILYDVS